MDQIQMNDNQPCSICKKSVPVDLIKPPWNGLCGRCDCALEFALILGHSKDEATEKLRIWNNEKAK